MADTTRAEITASEAGVTVAITTPDGKVEESKLTATSVLAKMPGVVQAIRDESFAAGREAGAVAERERLVAIEARFEGRAGHDALRARCRADGAMTPAAAAEAILEAERDPAWQELARMRASDQVIPVAGGGLPTDVSTLPVDERAKAMWERDAAIRGEFPDFATYLAYEKNKGRVRLLGQRSAA